MKKAIVISSNAEDTRIAITEDGKLAELFLETPDTQRMVGDIYLGEVMKVIPGMNAAFINVGLKQDAFLHFSDIDTGSIDEYADWFDDDDDDEDDDDGDLNANPNTPPQHERPQERRHDNRGPRENRNAPDSHQAARPEIIPNANDAPHTDAPVHEDLDPNWRPPENRAPRDDRGRRDDRGPRDDRGRRDDRGGRNNRPAGGQQMNSRHQMQQDQQRRVNIQKGQNILVQVTREPVGNKGVRVTTRISIPGRFLVLIPFDGRIGVSRKVQNIRERRRLRRVVRSLLPEGFGAIIRTVAENKDETLIRQDLQSLIDTYKEIEKKSKTEKSPILVFKDLSISTSVIRDLFTRDVEKVVTDNKKLFKEVGRYVAWAAPNLLDKVILYEEKEPIFDRFGIEQEIETTLSRKVYLPNGGYIIIEHTEAMVVVDVNSGRYAAKSDQELNSLRTNLESAREIARQIRLRDLGGIIVIDFIDMHEERNKKKVYDEIRKEFKRDRAKSTVLPLSDFGVMQITRQRMRQTLLHSVSEPCTACAGTGMVQSKHTILSTIDRWLRRAKSTLGERKFILEVNPLMEKNLNEGFISPLRKMNWKHHISVKLQSDEQIGVDEFKLFSVKQKKDVTADLK